MLLKAFSGRPTDEKIGKRGQEGEGFVLVGMLGWRGEHGWGWGVVTDWQ